MQKAVEEHKRDNKKDGGIRKLLGNRSKKHVQKPKVEPESGGQVRLACRWECQEWGRSLKGLVVKLGGLGLGGELSEGPWNVHVNAFPLSEKGRLRVISKT